MEALIHHQVVKSWTDICLEAKYVRGLGGLGGETLTSP